MYDFTGVSPDLECLLQFWKCDFVSGSTESIEGTSISCLTRFDFVSQLKTCGIMIKDSKIGLFDSAGFDFARRSSRTASAALSVVTVY